MSRTIVQEYGPIYGEPVNGTVMGRPNGSVYVPSTNTVGIDIPDGSKYYAYANATTLGAVYSDGGSISDPSDLPRFYANSQDLSSNIQVQIYSDSALTTLVAHRDLPAGMFNGSYGWIYNAVAGLTDGQTLYLRAQLMNSGSAVATSDTIPVTMVVP